MKNLRKCECGSELFATCTDKSCDCGHHCANCGKKVYIDWTRDYIIET